MDQDLPLPLWLPSPGFKIARVSWIVDIKNTDTSGKQGRPKTTRGIKILVSLWSSSWTSFISKVWKLLCPALEGPGQPGSSGREQNGPAGLLSQICLISPVVPHASRWGGGFTHTSHFLHPYSLQSNDSSVSYSTKSHQFRAPFDRFVSLSFPRNVTVSFLHLLPENQEPGELAAQSWLGNRG